MVMLRELNNCVLVYRRENDVTGRRWGGIDGPETKPAAPSSGAAGVAVGRRQWMGAASYWQCLLLCQL